MWGETLRVPNDWNERVTGEGGTFGFFETDRSDDLGLVGRWFSFVCSIAGLTDSGWGILGLGIGLCEGLFDWK